MKEPSTTRQLRFRRRIRIQYVPCIDDISEAELEARWYSPADYHTIKEETTAMAGKLPVKGESERREYEPLLLGLETAKERIQRRKRVSASRLALLREQQKYWGWDG
jgi:hypothetical protein